MKIFEYQGKELFNKFGIPVPEGLIIEEKRDIRNIVSRVDRGNGVVLKAQVLTGGRGKARGIRFAGSVAECENQYDELINMSISGHPVRKILLEEKIRIQQEFYLGVIVDTETGQPVVIICSQGGIDVEELSKTHPESMGKIAVDVAYGLLDYQVRAALIRLGAAKELLAPFIDIAKKLYRFFMEYDSVFAEINPLVLDAGGSLIAADARIDIDGAALYRHPDIQEMKSSHEASIEETLRDEYQLEYVELDGNIGLISGGAGLTMTAMDCITTRRWKARLFHGLQRQRQPDGIRDGAQDAEFPNGRRLHPDEYLWGDHPDGSGG